MGHFYSARYSFILEWSAWIKDYIELLDEYIFFGTSTASSSMIGMTGNLSPEGLFGFIPGTEVVSTFIQKQRYQQHSHSLRKIGYDIWSIGIVLTMIQFSIRTCSKNNNIMVIRRPGLDCNATHFP